MYLAMAEVRKGFWRCLLHSPCWKQGRLEQAAQGHCLGFWRAPGSEIPQLQWRVFFYVLVKRVSICAHWLLCCHWASLRWVTLPLLYFPHEVFIQLIKFPQSFSFPHWTCASSIISLSFCAWDRCTNLFIIFMALRWAHFSMSTSLFYWEAQNQSQHSRCLTSAEQRGRTCWQHSSWFKPGCCCLSLLQGCVAHSWSLWCLSRPQVLPHQIPFQLVGSLLYIEIIYLVCRSVLKFWFL